MCVYVCREHVGIASKRIEHVNQALDNSSIYCCCWAILHGQIIYEKPNENLWQRLTSTKIHTHNLCVFFSRLANFHSAAIFVSTVSHLFSPCERALISARHFLLLLLLLLCSARFRRIHENAVCIQFLQCRRLTKKKKRVNNTNWRRNIEWRVTIVCTQQQGIHTCVWQFFWCEWARELQFFANNTKIACHGSMSVWVPPRASERVRVNAFNHINKKTHSHVKCCLPFVTSILILCVHNSFFVCLLAEWYRVIFTLCFHFFSLCYDSMFIFIAHSLLLLFSFIAAAVDDDVVVAFSLTHTRCRITFHTMYSHCANFFYPSRTRLAYTHTHIRTY